MEAPMPVANAVVEDWAQALRDRSPEVAAETTRQERC
jgi:hypothetical protein